MHDFFMTRAHPQVEIHVEQLVLHGFDELDHEAVLSSFRGALERYFSESMGSIPERGVSHVKLDGGTIEWNGTSAESIGEGLGDQVARTIAR